MGGLIEQGVAAFLMPIGSGGVFLCAVAVGLVGLIVNVFLSVFKVGYVKIKRLWYALMLIATTAICGGITVVCGYSAGLFLVLIGVYVLFSTVVFYLPQKTFTKEQLDLARLMDLKAKAQGKEDNATTFQADKENKNVQKLTIPPQTIEDNFSDNDDKTLIKDSFGLDFSHVKNVLKRLDYFTLSPTDKRQVRELETLMFKAENGEKTDEIKRELNDGLGALLKIMSKYGV